MEHILNVIGVIIGCSILLSIFIDDFTVKVPKNKQTFTPPNTLSIEEKEKALLSAPLNISIEQKKYGNNYYRISFIMNEEHIDIDERDKDSAIFIAYAIAFEGLKPSSKQRLSDNDFFSMAGDFVKENLPDVTDKYLDLCEKYKLNLNEKILMEKFIADQFGMNLYIARLKNS